MDTSLKGLIQWLEEEKPFFDADVQLGIQCIQDRLYQGQVMEDYYYGEKELARLESLIINRGEYHE